MTNSIISLLVVFTSYFSALHLQTSSTHQPDAILGKWTNEKKDAKFEIYKSGTKYFGKIIWGTGRDPKDIYNPDPKLQNRELNGVVLLNNFEYDGKNVWDEGTIYDPNNGKTYSCKLTLTNSNTLEVRGYVGFSLFGRTDIWTRINN